MLFALSTPKPLNVRPLTLVAAMSPAFTVMLVAVNASMLRCATGSEVAAADVRPSRIRGGGTVTARANRPAPAMVNTCLRRMTAPFRMVASFDHVPGWPVNPSKDAGSIAEKTSPDHRRT